MKTTIQIMDKVRLHTVLTVALLMLAIVYHNTNPVFMILIEVVLVGFWFIQFDAAEGMCELLYVDELLKTPTEEVVDIDCEFFDKLEEALK